MSPFAAGALLLLLGNLSSSFSDVAVKLLEGGVSAFQYMFIRQLFSVLLLLPLWLKLSPQQQAIGNRTVTFIRSHLVLAGSGLVMIALTWLPLATANALFYAAPLLMLPLSAWLLKEKPGWQKILATVTGFGGVLLVLRPDQFHWAAMAGLGCAFTLALYNVLVRKLPAQQPVVSTLFWTGVLSLPLAGILAAWFWQPISTAELCLIAASAVFTLGYHGCGVAAYRRAETCQLGLIEYSGLIFVTLIGIAGFDEIPDMLTTVGILLIVLPMVPLPKKRNSEQRHNAELPIEKKAA
ncbi:DMT family transporter [Photobacterium obscurum]|uniref:DMT family transporter n=1 Tax=Photobacterium obscurum TaxID=2829490 RepID=UPI00389A8CB7